MTLCLVLLGSGMLVGSNAPSLVWRRAEMAMLSFVMTRFNIFSLPVPSAVAMAIWLNSIKLSVYFRLNIFLVIPS